MATRPEMKGERASNEATEWLIELQEEPDNLALRLSFAAWLAANPANKAAWEETAHAYDLIGPVASGDAQPFRPFSGEPATASSGGTTAWQPNIALARRHRRRFSTRRIALCVGATAIAASLALVFLPNALLRWQADYATGTGEQRAVNLADGTTVELGPDSAIDVAYADHERRVRLLAGQAFFEVTHDAERPFRVEARGLQVTDIGTGFDVQLARDNAFVTVTHGAVRVDYAGASPPVSQNLRAGQWVRVTWAGGVAQGSEPMDQIASWRQGQFIANDRPVSEVVDEFRPYFGGLIVLTSDDLGRRRVTGVYNLRDPVAALHALVQAHLGLSVHRISPWLLIVFGG